MSCWHKAGIPVFWKCLSENPIEMQGCFWPEGSEGFLSFHGLHLQAYCMRATHSEQSEWNLRKGEAEGALNSAQKFLLITPRFPQRSNTGVLERYTSTSPYPSGRIVLLRLLTFGHQSLLPKHPHERRACSPCWTLLSQFSRCSCSQLCDQRWFSRPVLTIRRATCATHTLSITMAAFGRFSRARVGNVCRTELFSIIHSRTTAWSIIRPNLMSPLNHVVFKNKCHVICQ